MPQGIPPGGIHLNYYLMTVINYRKKGTELCAAVALSVLMLACHSDKETFKEDSVQEEAVGFSVYVNRPVTRAGSFAVQTIDAMKEGSGFGVYGYYTDNSYFEELSKPNFMFNQQVKWDNGNAKWTYSPIKYWPNETGPNAISRGTDRLSFFAYAPYVEVSPTTGMVSDDSLRTGITRLTPSINTGGPRVRYYTSFKPAESVDLCWATPHFNLTKQDIADKVVFKFQHALAALNVQIDAIVDGTTPETSLPELDQYTRIYVRDITFEGFSRYGDFSLSDSTWYDLDCCCELDLASITLHDGRRNGREGVAATTNETPTGLNPLIIQSAPYTVSDPWDNATYSTTPGVTPNSVNLFDVSVWPYADPANPTLEEIAAALAAPIYVIPNAEPLTVTITYDVETYDPKLKSERLSDGRTNGSSIQNTLTAVISPDTDGIIMEAGKVYTLHLHLGMTSVKTTVDVTEWVEGYNLPLFIPYP